MEKTVRIEGHPVTVMQKPGYFVAWHPETGLVATDPLESEVERKMGACLRHHFAFAARHGLNPFVDEHYLSQHLELSL
jgi:hypothetical protein